MFVDKTLMITGGTGSFGNAVLSRFLKSDITNDIKEIRIFSRDEKKQEDMRIALIIRNLNSISGMYVIIKVLMRRCTALIMYFMPPL